MINLFIAGRVRGQWPVTPDKVQPCLAEIWQHLETFRENGRVTVTLDSFDHPNVTYIIATHAKAETATIPDWENAS